MLTVDSIFRCMKLEQAYGERGQSRSIGAKKRIAPAQIAKPGEKTVHINVFIGKDPETGEHRMMKS